MKKKTINIALQGGGTHLAFSWGVIDYLLEDGRFAIEGLSGTSAGGLTCAALAQGLEKNGLQGGREELAAFWEMVVEQGALLGLAPSYIDRMFGLYGMDYSLPLSIVNTLLFAGFLPFPWSPFGLNNFKKLLNNFFDFEKLSQNKEIKLFLTATNVLNSKLKIFTGEELTVEAFMASACVPHYSQTVEIKGEFYWDGGYIGNPSLFPLIYNCDSPDILVILVVPYQINTLPSTVKNINWRMHDLFLTNTLVREMRAIEFVTNLINQQTRDNSKSKKVNVHVIEDNQFFADLDPSSRLNTDENFLKILYERGRAVAAIWVEKNYDNIGKRSTFDVKETFV